MPGKPTPEEMRRRALLGKAASPWSKQAMCATSKARKDYEKGKRLYLIRDIAARKKNP